MKNSNIKKEKVFDELNKFVLEKIGNKKFIYASEVKLNNYDEFEKLMKCRSFGSKPNKSLIFTIVPMDELITFKSDNQIYRYYDFGITLFYYPEFPNKLLSFINECNLLHEEYEREGSEIHVASKLDHGKTLQDVYNCAIYDIEQLLCILKFVDKLRNDKEEHYKFIIDHCRFYKSED